MTLRVYWSDNTAVGGLYSTEVPALAARAVVVTVFLVFGVPSSGAQLSPGPLSEAHSSLDSLFACTSRHALGTGRAEFRCTDCHTEIRNRIADDRGEPVFVFLIARMMRQVVEGIPHAAAH